MDMLAHSPTRRVGRVLAVFALACVVYALCSIASPLNFPHVRLSVVAGIFCGLIAAWIELNSSQHEWAAVPARRQRRWYGKLAVIVGAVVWVPLFVEAVFGLPDVILKNLGYLFLPIYFVLNIGLTVWLTRAWKAVGKGEQVQFATLKLSRAFLLVPTFGLLILWLAFAFVVFVFLVTM